MIDALKAAEGLRTIVQGTLARNIKFVDGTVTPHIDMRSGEVVLSRPNAYLTEAEFEEYCAVILHEFGHLAPELQDMAERMTSIPNKKFAQLLNIVEDIRDERNKHGEFAGRDRMLGDMQARLARSGAEVMRKPDNGIPEWFSTTMVAAYRYRESTFQPQIDGGLFDVDTSGLDPIVPMLDKMRTAEDCWAVAEWLYDYWNDDSSESEPESDPSDGKGEPDDGESDSESDDSEADKSDDSDEGVPDDMMKDFMPVHGEIEVSDDDGPRYERDMAGVYRPWDRMLVKRGADEPRNSTIEDYLLDTLQPTRLSNEVRRLLNAKAVKHKRHRQEAGKLSGHHLADILRGRTDVFNVKDQRLDPKGTALFILADFSGSMKYRDAYKHQTKALIALNEAVGPIGTPTKIVGFSEQYLDGCRHWVLKDWKERRSPYQIMSDCAACWMSMHQNADGESIQWAVTQLRKRDERRKVLIVLSDGAPCCDNSSGDSDAYLKAVIQDSVRFCEIVGIGMGVDYVKDYYPEWGVVNGSNLESELLKVLKEKLL